MTDHEKRIVEGLISRDEEVTNGFFYAQCKPLFSAVAREVFMDEMDYDAIIDSFYNYLMADDAAELRRYAEGKSKSTIYKWLRVKALEHFHQLKKAKKFDKSPKFPLYSGKEDEAQQKAPRADREMDIASMIDMIDLERDRLVLEKIDVEGVSYDELSAQTGLSKANLYNIRKRAIERLKAKARIALKNADALCAIRCEQYVLDMFGIHKPISELKRLAESKGWLTDNGVAIENLGKMPRQFGLSVRSIRSDISRVAASIAVGKQVIVAVDGGELIGNPFEEALEDILVGGIADHCVVVLHYDKAEGKVMLFNPAFGDIPLTVSLETFLDAWEDSGFYTIEVGRK